MNATPSAPTTPRTAGQFLAALAPEQEDRILTWPMAPGSLGVVGEYGPCLVGTAYGVRANWDASVVMHRIGERLVPVEQAYDLMCLRLGTARTNRMLRERVLRNQVRRTLGGTVAGTNASTPPGA